MEYQVLGRTGVKVAPLCLGTDNFANPTPEAQCIEMIYRAIDAGINLIDTGNVYADGESERIIGKALSEQGRRRHAIIATKAHFPMGPGPNDGGNSRLHLLRACEDSLRRLRTDYIDLYQLHRPSFDIPIEETLGALTDLVRQGKVRYVGSSTAPAWKVMEGLMMSELKGYVRFVSEQPPYNLLDRRIENELIPMCRAQGLGVLPWAPLAHGVLAGRYSDARAFAPDSRAALRGSFYADRVTARGIEVGRRFVEVAREINLSGAQLALLWVKSQPGITAPLIGPRTLDQLEHFLPIMEMELDPRVRALCDELVPPGSAVTNFHNTAPWMKDAVVG